MSWIEKLYQTYENNLDKIGDKNDATPLLPICHTMQNAHIEIVIDGDGNFRHAAVIGKDDSATIVPCTEASASRSGVKPVNHPLCDKLQYIAGDFVQYGGEVTKGFLGNPYEPQECYKADLFQWASSESSHPKVNAILTYVRKGSVVSDLVAHGILHAETKPDDSYKLRYEWEDDNDPEKPAIFKILNGKLQKNGKRNPWQAEAFVRWRVEIPENQDASITDPGLQNAWITYTSSLKEDMGTCFVSGQVRYLADSHPSKLRNAGDKAKLISSNDKSGFTYRGRFTDDKQVAQVGFEMTQKAHNALRWLIPRQGKVFYAKSGGQVKPRLSIVAWSISGARIPDPLADSDNLLNDDTASEQRQVFVGDTAQEFGVRFSKYISGYSAKLGSTDQIVIMGIDSATPGRMAITYYRELTGSDFLSRIESWHKGCAWLQRFTKDKVFFGAPSPADIAQIAYGTKDNDSISLDGNLKKTTVERILPCIIDGAPLPWDLVQACIRKATQRHSLPDWAWQKALGIACGLYRYYFREKEAFKMGLDRERRARDYLYGRLLAVADCIEGWALGDAGEKRPTNASRLMQRFANHPFQTWRNIALSLSPYKARMGNRIRKHLEAEEEIMNLFDTNDFTKDQPLTGEFLLGFHCQRHELHKSTKDNKQEAANESEE